ncbi:hypothetical protein CORT_0B10170 [Candida orthopsilosis Co 90-125]|uniref:Mediator of RNA polymerase II transcription subunit 22 n=1 Tax=Candida orthopsilosis (strain 90-125) TaxID=1136231 RepID=H8X200_CANO9|nr:hypothetical protein CORT_0B10170 [Candida orthopsilosis Co 90-125]CCG22721.1 hypothetical protein CORT_0B10170 [Candida orthopsilosis Co 90-125]
MQPKSITLLQKIDSIVEQILLKFQNILEVLTNDSKPKELLSIESLTIESDAIQIIRYSQDLLSISRSLKESWVLGSLKVKGCEGTSEGMSGEGEVANMVTNWNEGEVDKVFKLFNELTDSIATFERPKAQS